MYDELEYQLGSMSKSSSGHSSSLLVKLTNRTSGLVEDEMKDLDEGAGTLSILASHKVNYLAFIVDLPSRGVYRIFPSGEDSIFDGVLFL